MPHVERQKPLHLQIADYYRQAILEGRLRHGDKLPSVRQVRDEWDVGQNVAQRAFEQLGIVEHLVRTTPAGTFVDGPRAAISPQQRVRLNGDPASEVVTVTAAGFTGAPGYVATILGLSAYGPPANPVIRREQVTRRADGGPHMLSVTWVPPQFAEAVPELLAAEPLPDPRGAGPLVAGRTGREFAEMTGGTALECRAARDDGRELAALGLEPGAHVLAGVYSWRDGEDFLEYTEFVLPPGQVVKFDLEP